MNIEQLRRVITRCISLDPNDDFGMEKCWEEMTDILSANIHDTILFINNDCTDEELYWLGSVFEDVAEKTQSNDFIKTLRDRLARVSQSAYAQQSFVSEHMRKWVDFPEYVRSISSDIDFAEEKINPQ